MLFALVSVPVVINSSDAAQHGLVYRLLRSQVFFLLCESLVLWVRGVDSIMTLFFHPLLPKVCSIGLDSTSGLTVIMFVHFNACLCLSFRLKSWHMYLLGYHQPDG